MSDRLPGICFLGCGNIAAKHTKILKKLYPKIEISFASRNASTSKEFAAKYKGKHSFGRYEEALMSNSFDIAFITTPHAYHSELAVIAANNKKDIIIEKPITRNLKELQDIEKAVQKNKVRCVVAENYHYKPFIKIVREHIENGLIGDVLFIELNKTNKDEISGWRTDAEIMGGGALLEGGVHWINSLLSLAGAYPVEALAIKPDVNYTTDVPFEDSIMLCVKFDNGLVGKLLHSWRIPNPLKGVGISKIYGTDGVITFESNGLYVSLKGKKKKRSFINPADFLGFKAMHKEFIDAYKADKDWQPSLERTKVELNLIETAYRSITSKKFEKIT